MPVTQDGEAGFYKGTTAAKDAEMSKDKGIAEGVVFDVSHIPVDYVAMATFHQNCKRHHNALVHACEDDKIRRIRFRRSAGDKFGLMYVQKDDAAAIVAESDAKFAGRHEAQRPETDCEPAGDCSASVFASRHAERVCESLASIDSTLDEIYRVLERLTSATESIATQPKDDAAGTWRDMNGEAL